MGGPNFKKSLMYGGKTNKNITKNKIEEFEIDNNDFEKYEFNIKNESNEFNALDRLEYLINDEILI